ncbi:MAG: 4Fe-4S dicluster domain-containing protein [Oscillospiraceae bacterium]|nr:4Fe-4S dicluster domain-containing protein [Clostridiales bacterium]MDD7674210.1 4Fe-4S dicluster domain-containing protein [Oscillospiraceae bacterium]
MRGIPSLITDIRKKVFTEVARMAYTDGDYTKAEDLPYVIVPGDQPLHRESIFLERAIAGERVRLAMGLSVRSVQTRSLITEGMDHAAIAQQYYEPPLINIIPYACHACPTNQYRVTESCQNCLAASCQKVCPRDAISFVNGKSRIDTGKCIKCGKCAAACSYHAIIHIERPCQAACGMDAIGMDENGKAVINQDKCVSCGQCLVSCPFGAIVDKGQIYQVVRSIVEGNQVIAIVAPAFIGQFGKYSTPEKFTAAMKRLGFDRVVEVAVGADMCTIEEAKDFLEKVPAQQNFMATSCCPAWHSMVHKLFPAQSKNISMTLTPMVFTARLMKKQFPGCKVVFVGPCAAKKLEAIRENIRSDVDFVLTFEELQGMFEAKEVDFATIEAGEPMNEGTAAGRGFAVSGGVAGAVEKLIHETNPDLEVKTARAEGLRECRKLMTMAKAGKYNGYLLEGMACPGGCVAGAGTILPVDLAAKVVGRYQSEAKSASPLESPYRDEGEKLD